MSILEQRLVNADIYASGDIQSILNHQKPPHRKNVREFIARCAVNDKKNAPWVDVACGYRNNFPEAVGSKEKQAKYLAFDHTVQFDQPVEGFDPIFLADAQNIPLLNGTIGTVICTEALEHIKDDKMAVREMSRILKPGGTLIITVPGKDVPIHEKLPYQVDYRKNRGQYTPESIKSMLEAEGVKDITTESCYLDGRQINIMAVGKKHLKPQR